MTEETVSYPNTTPAVFPANDSQPVVEVVVAKSDKPKIGLEADAENAKEFHLAQEKAAAKVVQDAIDSNKIVPPTPIIGYESSRAHMFDEPKDKK